MHQWNPQDPIAHWPAAGSALRRGKVVGSVSLKCTAGIVQFRATSHISTRQVRYKSILIHYLWISEVISLFIISHWSWQNGIEGYLSMVFTDLRNRPKEVLQMINVQLQLFIAPIWFLHHKKFAIFSYLEIFAYQAGLLSRGKNDLFFYQA